MTAFNSVFEELNDRSREVFRHIVDSYMQTGDPVGSRTLSRQLQPSLSPATIRNVMADLEDLGLLHAPHTSAGRLPTQLGLRLFIDGFMEVGRLSAGERSSLEAAAETQGRSMRDVLTRASESLSGLSACASLVMAPTSDAPVKHVEFVPISPGKVLAVIVSSSGAVENRLLTVPPGTPHSAFQEASNYLNARLMGRTIAETRAVIDEELTHMRSELHTLTQSLVEQGLAELGGEESRPNLIVRGRSNLLGNVAAVEDLNRVRDLFDLLEQKESLINLLDLTDGSQGVQIFIGTENKLFDMSGCSLVVAPYQDSEARVVGAIGVIGPTRLNYGRIIPMVDYTAQVVSRLLS